MRVVTAETVRFVSAMGDRTSAAVRTAAGGPVGREHARSNARSGTQRQECLHPTESATIADIRAETRRSTPSQPVGPRAEIPFERQIKPWFDRLGIWTRAAR